MFAIINTGAEMPRSCARPAAPELELAFLVPRRRPHHRPAIAHPAHRAPSCAEQMLMRAEQNNDCRK